jgi:hypothetical protein
MAMGFWDWLRRTPPKTRPARPDVSGPPAELLRRALSTTDWHERHELCGALTRACWREKDRLLVVDALLTTPLSAMPPAEAHPAFARDELAHPAIEPGVWPTRLVNPDIDHQSDDPVACILSALAGTRPALPADVLERLDRSLDPRSRRRLLAHVFGKSTFEETLRAFVPLLVRDPPERPLDLSERWNGWNLEPYDPRDLYFPALGPLLRRAPWVPRIVLLADRLAHYKARPGGAYPLEPNLEELRSCVESAEGIAAAEAARAIGRCGGDAAAAMLASWIDHPSPHVRLHAALRAGAVDALIELCGVRGCREAAREKLSIVPFMRERLPEPGPHDQGDEAAYHTLTFLCGSPPERLELVDHRMRRWRKAWAGHGYDPADSYLFRFAGGPIDDGLFVLAFTPGTRPDPPHTDLGRFMDATPERLYELFDERIPDALG